MSAILTDGPGVTVRDVLTVGDFVGLPPEQIDACLADFRRWIVAVQAFSSFGREVPRRFVWLNDGHPFLYVRLPHSPHVDFADLAQKLYGIAR